MTKIKASRNNWLRWLVSACSVLVVTGALVVGWILFQRQMFIAELEEQLRGFDSVEQPSVEDFFADDGSLEPEEPASKKHASANWDTAVANDIVADLTEWLWVQTPQGYVMAEHNEFWEEFSHRLGAALDTEDMDTLRETAHALRIASAKHFDKL